VRHPRPVLLACLVAVLAAALPARAQDVAPPEPPRLSWGIADKYHGPGAYVRVACSAACDITGKLTIGYNMKVFLRLKSKTVGTGKGHLDGAGLVDVLVDLNTSAIRAVHKRHGNQLPVRLDASAKDSDGRTAKLSKKNIKIPL
jgi:hypothetical protein